MELPDNLSVVMQNASQYFVYKGATIPVFQREKIVDLMNPGVSPVDYIVKASEVLYGIREQLDDEGNEIAAQLANLAYLNGWHDMNIRGPEIVKAIKRNLGEEIPGEDIESKEEYLEPIQEEPIL